MKNKVIQKFFTILLGLMMVSPGWAATQYCETATGHQGNADFDNKNACVKLSISKSSTAGFIDVKLAMNRDKSATSKIDYIYVLYKGLPYTAGTDDNGDAFDELTAQVNVGSDVSGSLMIQYSNPNWGGRWQIDLSDVDFTASCGGTSGEDPVESVSLDKSEITLKITKTQQLNATIAPNTAADKTVTWSSSAEGVATVSETGLVTAVAVGEATITATSNGDDTKSASCKVTVIEGNPDEVDLTSGTHKITYTAYIIGNDKYQLTIKSKEKISKHPNSYWNINGVGGTRLMEDENTTCPDEHTIIITVTSNPAPQLYTPLYINMPGEVSFGQPSFDWIDKRTPVAVESVTLNETNLELGEGEFSQLTATVAPAELIDKTVTWSSNKGEVATVDATGKVVAKAEGTAIITATSNADDTKSASCTVTVTHKEITAKTWWGKGSFSTFTALYSVTRNVNKTLTYELELDEIPTDLDAQVNVKGDDVYNNLTSIGNNKYSFTTTETFADGTVLNGFFHLPYADAGLGHIDVAYTVGSENVKPAIEVTGVSINPGSAAVEVGKTTSLTAIIKPAFATNTNISWSVIAGSEHASVDANGVVTGLAAGAATVQVTTESGSKTATCDVNVVAQILLEPNAAPAAPTVPANQVKAVYSTTYSADCGFGDWGGGTAYKQDTYGKKYVNGGGGYFGMVDFTYNCSQMEKLHLDVWAVTDLTFRVVPIHGGAEQGVTVNISGQQWNSIDIALNQGDWANVTDWSNVYQIKIDQAANETFWLNNVYFYTTQTKNTCALSASVKNNEGGTASVDNAKVAKGGMATFTAEAACGYSFVGWWNNTTKVSENTTYTPTDIQEDLSLVAEFSFVGPSEAATVKTYDQMISIYGVGTPIQGVNTLVYWGDYDHTAKAEVSVAGHTMTKYGHINFQGVDFDGNRQDVSAMKYIHMDIWSNKEGDIRFYPINASTDLIFVVLHLDECQWNSFDIELSEFGDEFDLTTIRQLKFNAQKVDLGEDAVEGATILVQDIFFYAPNEFTLSETESNETNLEAFNGKACDVTIARTFTAGSLYTLALPFDMDADQVEETFRACTMYKLADSYWKVEGENMYIRFAPVTEFKANTPILFTPTETIENAVAKDVTIKNGDCKTITTLVTFHGTYSKMALAAPYYILAADQYLYPVVGDEYYINGMRGYFSWGAGVSQAPKMARVILHEEITTDNALVPAAQGATKKVMENGRFVIIRDGVRYGILGVEE